MSQQSPARSLRDVPSSQRRPADRRWPIVAASTAVTALVVSLLAAGGAPVAAPPGLPDAGLAVGWAVPLSRLFVTSAAALTVGFLATAVVLVPRDAPGLRGRDGRAIVRSAGRTAVVWSSAALGAFWLLCAEAVGRSPTALSFDDLMGTASRPQGRALLAVSVVALTIASLARHVRTARASTWLLLLAVAGTLPVPLSGHVASGTDRDIAVSALAVHVVAATLWVGGLTGLLVHLRRRPQTLRLAARRFSVLALGSYVALAGSGLLVATTRLGLSPAAWTTGYGGLVAAKAALLLGLGVVGALHRGATLPLLDAGRPTAFIRLACAELALMGVAAGMATALARSPAPVPAGLPAHAADATVGAPVEPFGWEQLATAWRVNAVVLVVLALALVVYSAGERAVSDAGESWPRSRSIAFRGGLLLFLATTCSGAATYAPAMISLQIGQLIVATFLVPLLLVSGAPVSLWLRTRHRRRGDGPGDGPGDGVAHSTSPRWAGDVVTGAALVCGLLILMYRSPLVEWSLRSSWVQLIALAAAVAAGCLFLWPLVAADQVAGPRGRAERAAALAVVSSCLAVLAVQLGGGDRLLASRWLRLLELRSSWVDPVADQRAGAVLLGAAGALVLVGACLVLVRQRR